MLDIKPIKRKIPLAYFITFTCYGTWLHGSKLKSVDRHRNKPNTAYVSQSLNKERTIKEVMLEPGYLLNNKQRNAVLEAIKHVCAYRCWDLFAAHVRTNHVHVIVSANTEPEIIMNTIKAYASRQLKALSPASKRLKYWTRHGSTRYLWQTEHVVLALRYVIYDQGESMALYNSNKYSLDLEEFI